MMGPTLNNPPPTGNTSSNGNGNGNSLSNGGNNLRPPALAPAPARVPTASHAAVAPPVERPPHPPPTINDDDDDDNNHNEINNHPPPQIFRGVGAESLPPLQRRLMKVLKDSVGKNSVADVHLVGDDGIAVPALRCILSCTSPVFDRMLFGQFSEANVNNNNGSAQKITIEGVNRTVLAKMVEYCCSDALLSLDEYLEQSQSQQQQDQDYAVTQVTEAVLLAELGDKYQIPGLEAAVVTFLQRWMRDDPPLACVVFDLSHADITPMIRAAAWKVVSEQPHTALVGGGMAGLSASRLEELYQNATQIHASPLFLFQRLVEWYECHLNNNSGSEEETQDNDHVATVTATCRTASSFIRLSAIDPVSLKAVVRKAPFMEPEQILEAFMAQAMLAHNLGIDFSHNQKYQHGEQPRCRHVLIEGAGIDKINGIYVQDEPPITALIQQQFTKRNESTGEQVFLVQGREDGLWFICDPAQYYYHCKSPVDVLPSTGWSVVSSSQSDISPAPTCKFFFYNVPPTSSSDGANNRRGDKKKKARERQRMVAAPSPRVASSGAAASSETIGL